MNDDEVTIRNLIERWATAAHDGDLETVLRVVIEPAQAREQAPLATHRHP